MGGACLRERRITDRFQVLCVTEGVCKEGGEGEIEGGGGEARWRLGDSGSWVSVLGDSASCVSRSCTRACMLGCSGPGMCMTKLRHVGI